MRAVQLPGERQGHADSAGTTIEYTVPDVYNRPWAQIWERYFEQGMEHPEPEPLFGFK